MTQYVLRKGHAGAERLRLLARVHGAATADLLGKLELRPGMRCLDLGCGIGEVTFALARAVAPGGSAVGMDIDEGYLDVARAEGDRLGLPVEFRSVPASELDEVEAYDLVFARCLLSHVPDPQQVVDRMLRALRPGGVLAVEDIDFRGLFCHPPSAACERYVELYIEVVRQNGGDATRGAELLGLLQRAGAQDLGLHVALPTFIDHDGKSMAATTMEHIRTPVERAGLAAPAEIDALVRELAAIAADPHSLMSMPRVFQVWGRRPSPSSDT